MSQKQDSVSSNLTIGTTERIKMEPIRPEVRQAIIDNGYGTEEEIVEYEQLLAARFSRNTDAFAHERLLELYIKLFPTMPEGE